MDETTGIDPSVYSGRPAQALRAAANAQIRMQAELGVVRLERYLRSVDAFREWCRAHPELDGEPARDGD